MATSRGGGRNKRGFVGRGAQPAALEGALLGRLEGWRSCAQFILGPCPHALHLHTDHPKLLSQFQPFPHFLSPNLCDQTQVCHGKDEARRGGEGSLFSRYEQSHHHSLWDQTWRFVLHPRSRGTMGMGIPGGSRCAAATRTRTLYQQEARPFSSSL